MRSQRSGLLRTPLNNDANISEKREMTIISENRRNCETYEKIREIVIISEKKNGEHFRKNAKIVKNTQSENRSENISGGKNSSRTKSHGLGQSPGSRAPTCGVRWRTARRAPRHRGPGELRRIAANAVRRPGTVQSPRCVCTWRTCPTELGKPWRSPSLKNKKTKKKDLATGKSASSEQIVRNDTPSSGGPDLRQRAANLSRVAT